MYSLIVASKFDSAHHLRGHKGLCQRPHGHRFSYKVCLEGKILNELGMLVDFADVKVQMRARIEDWLDYQDLNQQEPFDKINPTAENLARFIFQTLREELNTDDIRVAWVEVWESEECGARYSEGGKE